MRKKQNTLKCAFFRCSIRILRTYEKKRNDSNVRVDRCAQRLNVPDKTNEMNECSHVFNGAEKHASQTEEYNILVEDKHHEIGSSVVLDTSPPRMHIIPSLGSGH